LVLAAAVTLVIGLLNSGLGLIYVSIACSVLAGVVLAAAVFRSRPRAEVQTGGPAPLPGSAVAPAGPAAAEEPTRADLGVVSAGTKKGPAKKAPAKKAPAQKAASSSKKASSSAKSAAKSSRSTAKTATKSASKSASKTAGKASSTTKKASKATKSSKSAKKR